MACIISTLQNVRERESLNWVLVHQMRDEQMKYSERCRKKIFKVNLMILSDEHNVIKVKECKRLFMKKKKFPAAQQLFITRLK